LGESNSGQNCPKPIRQNGQIAFHVNIWFALRPFFGRSKLTRQINGTTLCVRFSHAQNLTERIVLVGVHVSFTPSVHSRLLYRGVAFHDAPFHASLFPLSCKYSGILQLIGRAAAAFSATPARLGIKKSRLPKKATLLLRLLDGRRIHHHVNLRWYREPFPTSIAYKREQQNVTLFL